MWARFLLLAVFLCTQGGGASAVRANPAQPGTRPTQNTPGARASNEAGKAKEPVTDYRLTRERYDKAVSYSQAGYRLYFVSTIWGIAVLLLLLRSGFVAGLRDVAEGRIRSRALQAVLFVPVLFLTLALFHLPINAYGHQLSLKYEQSVQTWGPWLWDWTKSVLLEMALALFVMSLLFPFIRWKPRTWWFYAWLGAIPFSLFLVFISPLYIDPLFNKFTPLADSHSQLVESIEKLTERAGIPIPASHMFLMQASAKTNAINAYVTGLGASKRIVIWDTSIAKTQPDELLYIVGHEMGHYVLGHVITGFAWFLGLLLVGLYLAYRCYGWMIARWGGGWGVRGTSDWAAMAVLLLLLDVFSFFGEPIGNAISRRQEHAADQYGLELIHGMFADSGDVAARAFQVLGEEDLADPNPSRFITIWLYSHPPLAERLRFARTYDPWAKGEAPKYVK